MGPKEVVIEIKDQEPGWLLVAKVGSTGAEKSWLKGANVLLAVDLLVRPKWLPRGSEGRIEMQGKNTGSDKRASEYGNHLNYRR